MAVLPPACEKAGGVSEECANGSVQGLRPRSRIVDRYSVLPTWRRASGRDLDSAQQEVLCRTRRALGDGTLLLHVDNMVR